MDIAVEDQLVKLRAGLAFVRPLARTAAIRGGDAEGWLNDLLTARVAGLAVGESRRSLVLTPTGRIRAEVYVVRCDDGFVLVQSDDQREPVAAILSPYVLSSDVEVAASGARPVLVPIARGWRAALDPPRGAVEVDVVAADHHRIELGLARFPVDLDADSLPAEAGLDAPPVTDTTKGCFLGQESLARVRNLGHPTRLVQAMRADVGVTPGDAILADGAAVGVVTSAVDAGPRGNLLLARVRWDARDAELRTAAGVALRRR